MNKEINKELIEKQAKQILDKFASALEKVEKEKESSSYVERQEDMRIEKNKDKSVNIINSNFKEKILKNAPSKDSDFIIAEKGSWK